MPSNSITMFNILWLFLHEAVNINVIERGGEDFPANSRPFAQEISFLNQNETPTNWP